MRVLVVAVVSWCLVGAAHAQTGEVPSRLVANCTQETAFGVAFGERSDRMFAPAPDLTPYRGALALRRTQNSRQLMAAELTVELPDAATATEFNAAVETAAAAGGRFPQRTYNADDETITLTSADGALALELGTLGRGAYVTCVKPALRQLALDEYLGRVRVERPTPPSLSLPPRPDAAVCENPAARSAFVSNFETALQSPLEYATALNNYSSRLQAWYSQQLKDRSNLSADEEAALGVRILQDPVFSREAGDGMRRLAPFMSALTGFADARDAHNDQVACVHALEVMILVGEMSASSQRQWARIEALYREEATGRGVTLD